MKISIITINYNNGKGLEKTVNSVISQTYSDFQYIVIDGNSDDNSREILSRFDDEIDYWVSEPDSGIYNAMNKGITAAEGEYLLFLNSGDEFYNSEVLEKVNPFLATADLVSGSTYLIENGKKIIVNSPASLSFKHMYRYSIDHPSTFIRRSLFKTVGLYDEDLKIVSDWKWFITALAKYGALYKSIPLTIATFTADGISSQPQNKALLLAERKKVLDVEFPFFIKDYAELTEYEPYARNFLKLQRSRWVALGRKLGLLKNVDFS